LADKIKSLKYSFIDHAKEMEIEESLQKYLENLGKPDLFDSLSYILKEMVGNANKANLKRVHFFIKDLDIHDKDDYEKGISTFKEDLSQDHEIYIKNAEKLKYFVRIDFYISNNFFVILTSNNNPIHPIEKDRVLDRMKRAARFKTFEEVLEQGLDQLEGAGFGLILSLMMLRKIGLDERAFKLINKENYTQTQIIIPLTLISKEEGEMISETVVKVIDEIPQFPQHVMELQRQINDPNANFSVISHIIERDPAIIADLLKVANSAFYMLPKKVNSIQEAVRLIGFKGIRNLVITYTTRNILMNKFNIEVIKEIMDHSYEVAYYAYELAKTMKKKELIDDVYLCGILHDFGRIIANSINPDVMKKITEICNAKGIGPEILENLTSGYNHSIIGARLATKWNFPEVFVEAIKYHHIPLDARDEYKDLVYIIYLANTIFYYTRDEFDYTFINYQVLNHFNLIDIDKFHAFIKPITSGFVTKKKDFA
jgi:putative nucleotidyltransferase with HDIG domain